MSKNMDKNEIKKIAYVWNGLVYVDEDKLSLCACGGRGIVNFTNTKKRFTSMEIYCKDCGMSTDVCKDEIDAITKWENCFGDLQRVMEDAAAYQNEYYDDCLAFAGKCKYD